MTKGNAEAYLGLTDSIVGMIKFFHSCQPGTLEEAAIQKVIYIHILASTTIIPANFCSGKIYLTTN